jgi:hypothetical protein
LFQETLHAFLMLMDYVIHMLHNNHYNVKLNQLLEQYLKKGKMLNNK